MELIHTLTLAFVISWPLAFQMSWLDLEIAKGLFTVCYFWDMAEETDLHYFWVILTWDIW